MYGYVYCYLGSGQSFSYITTNLLDIDLYVLSFFLSLLSLFHCRPWAYFPNANYPCSKFLWACHFFYVKLIKKLGKIFHHCSVSLSFSHSVLRILPGLGHSNFYFVFHTIWHFAGIRRSFLICQRHIATALTRMLAWNEWHGSCVWGVCVCKREREREREGGGGGGTWQPWKLAGDCSIWFCAGMWLRTLE